jgi:hypothetical protein
MIALLQLLGLAAALVILGAVVELLWDLKRW